MTCKFGRFGKRMINDKAQSCAFIVAMCAIKKAALQLKGDLPLTAVAFETGKPLIDRQQGIDFPSEGCGTKWVVDRAVAADYALVGETSGFALAQAECGRHGSRFALKVREVYTSRLGNVMIRVVLHGRGNTRRAHEQK